MLATSAAAGSIPEGWDGAAAERIVDVLAGVELPEPSPAVVEPRQCASTSILPSMRYPAAPGAGEARRSTCTRSRHRSARRAG